VPRSCSATKQATAITRQEDHAGAWSDKDERKYEHIKDSSRERGVSEDRAKEIAARTVNKDRREEGRTPNRRTQGTGNPNRGYEAARAMSCTTSRRSATSRGAAG
jgi:plasmid stabilization system protein ParE